MPTLNWIGKEKIVNHDKDVPFRLLRKNKKYSLGKSENLILEGDNLDVLDHIIITKTKIFNFKEKKLI